MLDKYVCEVVDKEQLADGIFSISVYCADMAKSACPGQFLHIKCGDEHLLRRPISICSVNGNVLDLVLEIKGGGTQWLSRVLPGDFLDVIGPVGNGFSIPEGRFIVVGGGIGVPPMLYVAQLSAGRATALLGFRSINNILLKDEFDNVCERVIVTTDDGSFGVHGYLTVPLKELLVNGDYDAVLACGPTAMLSAVAQLCQLHQMPCQVSLEERMGCGVGACLVCACATMKDSNQEMSRICVDGPVFNASEVIW